MPKLGVFVTPAPRPSVTDAECGGGRLGRYCVVPALNFSEVSFVSFLCQSTRGKRERPDRRPARHTRSPDHEDDRPPADARLGDRAAHPADLRRLAARPAGISLPGAAPPRAPGLDHGGVGRVGEQSASPLLLADKSRPQAARYRALEMGAPLGRCQPPAAKDMTVRLWHILHSRLRSLLFSTRRETDLREE